MDKLTHGHLLDIIDYDPDSGIFRWKCHPSWPTRFPPGTIAGGKNSEGYMTVMIEGMRYKLHRLAWFYVNGTWPDGWLDHANGVRDDNRIANLRQATPSQNSCNSTGWNERKRGRLKGAYRVKKRWQAAITRNRELIYLGSFATEEEAHAAYLEAAAMFSGEFARGK